jgi:Mn2+/Fe2+ NRAMP family transporter
MEKTSSLLFLKLPFLNYQFWIILLSIGTIGIFTFLLSEMGTLVQIATILSFITAPFYAYLNLKLVTSDQMPKEDQPGKGLIFLSILGLIFLILFAIGFLYLAV